MRVFVYGTLMQGGANHRVLVALGARLVRAAQTAAPRTLVDLGPYPALLPEDVARDAARTRVHGELYEIEDGPAGERAIDERAERARSPIEVLDEFEGCPDLYARERVTLDDGSDAWTYALARAAPGHARVIDDGRYLRAGRVLVEDAREALDALDKGGANDDRS